MKPEPSRKARTPRHLDTPGQVFVPPVMPLEQASQPPKQWFNPFFRLARLAFILTLGWPLYLMFNLSGRQYDRSAALHACMPRRVPPLAN